MTVVSDFKIGHMCVDPGEKKTGFLPSNGLSMPDGTGNFWHIPVVVVRGVEDGPVFEVDGCIHGEEQEGAYTVLELAGRLDPENMRGTFIGVPVLNVPGFLAYGGVRGQPHRSHVRGHEQAVPRRPGLHVPH